MPQPFKDHFSGHATDYARYRPTYPDALFAWLADQAPARNMAWDCATGNGQAALALAAHFDTVIATDASDRQLAQATQHPKVSYRTAPAEQSGLPDASIDLITVAQALHWFEVTSFYAEAKRVLKPGGLLAVWCYGAMAMDNPALEHDIIRYYSKTVGAYWPPERPLVEAGYRTLDFPFAEINAPEFAMTATWNLDTLIGYLGTWSATRRYIHATGHGPLPELRRELAAHWGDPDAPRTIRWPLALRVGRMAA